MDIIIKEKEGKCRDDDDEIDERGRVLSYSLAILEFVCLSNTRKKVETISGFFALILCCLNCSVNGDWVFFFFFFFH